MRFSFRPRALRRSAFPVECRLRRHDSGNADSGNTTRRFASNRRFLDFPGFPPILAWPKMKLHVALDFAGQTHPGMVRPENEDSIAAAPECGLAVLADGMGGYNAGEVASEMATSILSTALQSDLAAWDEQSMPPGSERMHSLVRSGINRANMSIFQASQSDPRYAGMGTTIVFVLFHDEALTVAHIGDSRLYRLRGDELTQLTRDHSFVQEQIDAGLVNAEQAKLWFSKNLLTRALGVDPVTEAEIRDYELRAGDLYLLCSDGLTDMVEDAEIKKTLQLSSSNVEDAADNLVRCANEHGGRDNVSVIVVRVQPESKP